MADGTKRYPYTWAEYEELKRQGRWKGGWVNVFGELKYISYSNKQYSSSLGSKNDPCPMDIYYEMTSNGTWDGGWVIYGDESVYLPILQLDSNSGAGCGCGSGSGSDSGCGSGSESGSGCGSGSDKPAYPITSGEFSLGRIHAKIESGISVSDLYIEDLYIAWMPGDTYGSNNLASVSFSVKNTPTTPPITVSNSIDGRWTAPYVISYNGFLHVTVNTSYFSRNVEGTFEIPLAYRVLAGIDPSIQ